MRWTLVVAMGLLLVAGSSSAAPRTGADLAVTAFASRGVYVGDHLVFSVIVMNGGPRTASRLRLTVRLPVAVGGHGASLGPGRARATCDLPTGAGVARCTLTALRSRRAWIVRFEGTAAAPGELPVVASVRAATRDPVRRNNTARATSTVRSSPPPAPRPPPAFAAARGPEVALQLGSYCWSAPGVRICADGPAPAVESLAPLDVEAGDVVTFRLGFDPTEAVVLLGGSTVPLESSRTPTWRVPDGFAPPAPGALAGLAVRGPDGSAIYYARLM
jgi:hypothetical protein